MAFSLDSYLERCPPGVLEERVHAFIDESGDCSPNESATDFFVIGAVAAVGKSVLTIPDQLAALRPRLNRQPHHVLQFKKLSDTHRSVATTEMAKFPSVAYFGVVIAKRHLEGAPFMQDQESVYLYSLKFLLERLSWFAMACRRPLVYTLAHKLHMEEPRLREYEARLPHTVNCSIEWRYVDGQGAVSSPRVLEPLQLADMVASAICRGFEPAHDGTVRPDLCQNLRPRLYRHRSGRVESYGVKLFPNEAKAAHPWVAALDL